MHDEEFPISHSEEVWRRLLTAEQYEIMRGHGTEPAGSCGLNHEKRQGAFHCVGCDQLLFRSEDKFESGMGWPSFFSPEHGALGLKEDRRYGMTRTEVHCRQCGSHLGHVFPDGPPPTGLRYCINGVCLKFVAQ